MTSRALRNSIKRAIAWVCFYSGFIYLYEWLKRLLGISGIRILAYHNVSSDFPPYLALNVPPRLFVKQLEYLQKHYEIISLPEAVEIVKDKRRIGKSKFAFTFDDNYKEFFTELLPIKIRYGVPFAVFTTVGPLDNSGPLFPEAIIFAVSSSKRDNLDVRSFGLKDFPLRTNQEKGEAISSICEYARVHGRARAQPLFDFVLQELGVERGQLSQLSMGWQDVVGLRNKGVLIGSHGMTHALLSSLQEPELEFEIRESKGCLERRTGGEIKYFAYPYGSKESYDDRVLDCVARAGYEAAFVHGKSKVKSLYAVERMGMDVSVCSTDGKTFCEPLFALEVSGLAHYVFLRWLRRELNGNGA